MIVANRLVDYGGGASDEWGRPCGALLLVDGTDHLDPEHPEALPVPKGPAPRPLSTSSHVLSLGLGVAQAEGPTPGGGGQLSQNDRGGERLPLCIEPNLLYKEGVMSGQTGQGALPGGRGGLSFLGGHSPAPGPWPGPGLAKQAEGPNPGGDSLAKLPTNFLVHLAHFFPVKKGGGARQIKRKECSRLIFGTNSLR